MTVTETSKSLCVWIVTMLAQGTVGFPSAWFFLRVSKIGSWNSTCRSPGASSWCAAMQMMIKVRLRNERKCSLASGSDRRRFSAALGDSQSSPRKCVCSFSVLCDLSRSVLLALLVVCADSHSANKVPCQSQAVYRWSQWHSSGTRSDRSLSPSRSRSLGRDRRAHPHSSRSA
jgi:hypothetical protein